MNNDLFSRRFLTVCAGIAIVMLSTCALVFSVNQATATPSVPDEFRVPDEMPKMPLEGTANYLMDYHAVTYGNGGTGFYVLVWNPTTGKSKIYSYNTGSHKMEIWDEGALPVNPLD